MPTTKQKHLANNPSIFDLSLKSFDLYNSQHNTLLVAPRTGMSTPPNSTHQKLKSDLDIVQLTNNTLLSTFWHIQIHNIRHHVC